MAFTATTKPIPVNHYVINDAAGMARLLSAAMGWGMKGTITANRDRVGDIVWQTEIIDLKGVAVHVGVGDVCVWETTLGLCSMSMSEFNNRYDLI